MNGWAISTHCKHYTHLAFSFISFHSMRIAPQVNLRRSGIGIPFGLFPSSLGRCLHKKEKDPPACGRQVIRLFIFFVWAYCGTDCPTQITSDKCVKMHKKHTHTLNLNARVYLSRPLFCNIFPFYCSASVVEYICHFSWILQRCKPRWGAYLSSISTAFYRCS